MFESNEIKPLRTKFQGRGEVKGFNFRQIGATKRAFLYEVNTIKGKHYEVFKKRINRRLACVTYPNLKSYGKDAWIYEDILEAIKKYNELNYRKNDII